ncbi:hypothetical protein D6D04_09419 [Aureobasidium pullulans]|nr:hypothetical protein D6D04_09419 [Aureobasidium pullulans]
MFSALTLMLCLLAAHALVASGFSPGASLLPSARPLPTQLQYHRQENDRAWISLQPATSFASPTLHTVTFASISPNTVAVNNESGSANMLTQATYASNGEECPSGFETPRCDECGGAEQTIGETWNTFHCKGIEAEDYRWKNCFCMHPMNICPICQWPESSDDESDDGDDLNDSTESDDSEHTAADIQDGNNPRSTQNQQTDSDDQSPTERSRGDHGALSYDAESTSNGAEHNHCATPIVQPTYSSNMRSVILVLMFAVLAAAAQGWMDSPRISARSVSKELPWSAKRPPSVASTTASVRKGVLLLTPYDDIFFSLRENYKGLDAHCLPPTSLTCADLNLNNPARYLFKTGLSRETFVDCKVHDSFDPKTIAHLSTANAHLAIDKFCADKIAKVSSYIPPLYFPLDRFRNFTPDPERAYLFNDTAISIMARFEFVDSTVDLGGIDVQVGIDSNVDFLVKDREVVCRETLQRVVNECFHDTKPGTTGGYALECDKDYGCVYWQIWGSKR